MIFEPNFEKKTTVYRLGKMSNLGWKLVFEINTSSERAHLEQQNATFLFEIGQSELELCTKIYS